MEQVTASAGFMAIDGSRSSGPLIASNFCSECGYVRGIYPEHRAGCRNAAGATKRCPDCAGENPDA